MFNPSALDIQYGLTSLSDVALCLSQFKEYNPDYILAINANDVINNIINHDNDYVNHDLMQNYCSNLRKAIDRVYDGEYSEMHARMLANVTDFAGHKAAHATQDIINKYNENGNVDDAIAVINTYNRYQTAEYNTAVSRARTGKQWEVWNDHDNLNLFPNIMWLPSRSVELRSEHIPFYNRIWAKDDPFWNHNQPGSLWNCKCDWQQTNEPITDSNPRNDASSTGLHGNPGITGKIFSDDASYYRNIDKEKTNKEIYKQSRNIAREKATANLLNKSVYNPDMPIPIQFSNRKIKEFLNQNIDNYLEKNELLQFMPDIIPSATYKGFSKHKNRISHILSFNFMGKDHYLICQQVDKKTILLHSISDKKTILKGVTPPESVDWNKLKAKRQIA